MPPAVTSSERAETMVAAVMRFLVGVVAWPLVAILLLIIGVGFAGAVFLALVEYA